MNPYANEYSRKLISAQTAAAAIAQDSTIIHGVTIAEPPALLKAISDRARAGDLRGITIYSFNPQMIEGDVFRIIVKVPKFGAEDQKQVFKTETSGAQSGVQSGAQWQRMLMLLASEPLSAMDLAEALGLQSKTGSFKRSLAELLERELIAYTIPDKPGSRLQQYRLTSKGYEELNRLK